ncbi:alpha/beta fold hydrolase [Mycobacterium sp. CVI_P3]|uniref:Alpha/beta fold hydrolase n=1 Tax=Mycobacterium pinniadriaticum TaxID=2994102 RepID=A0ABT3SD10_9MYCO|nr:alpha/beta fold hydrolase [Mycobacterium pinniadriaticum]MCX2930967.1 alpha/beta fold hydrolase [Mycobacterium pinniadriaticum]MCX2937391.1 alpha/beta fold hydrolase [Mycobacterium pinniadriaticum]
MRDRDQRLRNEVEHPERYEEVTVTSSGVPIVLSVWHGQSGGPVVVFLPGTMTHPLFYEEFCDGLAAQGINVVGVHFEGHGKSPRVGRLLRLASLVANAMDATSWARARFGRRPIVVGSSQGGVLAMIVATRDHQLAGVVAHNILDPELPASITVSRFPAVLQGIYHPVMRGLQVLATLLPRLPIGFGVYLDMTRVCREPWTAEQFLMDPLSLRTYPLAFLADLLTADMSAVRDGTITCPVVVVAGRGDPLFSLDYTRKVFARIAAPTKELVVFDTDHHLLFNECLPLVLGRIAELVTHLDAH